MAAGYADSLAEFGDREMLPRSAAWVLLRPIDGTHHQDAMGCYPLLCCGNWGGLAEDLAELNPQLVSFTAVTDPFGGYSEALLQNTFCDLVRPFKAHFVADLRKDPSTIATSHHRYYARRAFKSGVQVERCEDPTRFLDEWTRLYAVLVERHRVRGVAAFSRAAFAAQLRLRDLTVFRATLNGETIGAHLWITQGEIVYSHLAAFSQRGYDVGAAYALYWESLHYFAPSHEWVDFGAGAGLTGEASDGLTAFKRGWSTGTRPVYLCGRVLNSEAYERLATERGYGMSRYFPAYRTGEFAAP